MAKISRRKIISLSAVSMLGTSLGLPASHLNNKNKDQNNKKKMKVIVVGAHFDDPETGYGGTMLVFSRGGHEVKSAYLTRGEAGISGKSHKEAASIRTGEAEQACKILKVKPKFLEQIDDACEVNNERYADVYQFLKEEKPNIVFTHWPIDMHRDHHKKHAP
jgi:LmbE family N-acetylglucosaminyl deacetylase